MNRAARIVVGRLEIDVGARAAWADGSELLLTRREFDLLACLAGEPGRVMTKQELLREVWGCSPGTRTLERHVHSLRHKLGAAGGALVTVWGVGYRLDACARPRG